jgi:hypothetical protein
VVEPWALQRQQELEDYTQKQYEYEKQRYMQQQQEAAKAQVHNQNFID